MDLIFILQDQYNDLDDELGGEYNFRSRKGDEISKCRDYSLHIANWRDSSEVFPREQLVRALLQ